MSDTKEHPVADLLDDCESRYQDLGAQMHARLTSVEAELAAAHEQNGQWRSAVVAANRLSQVFEARAVAAESLAASRLARLDAEHAALLKEIEAHKETRGERDEARETANGHRDLYATAYARLDAAAAEVERLHAEMEARVVAAVNLGLQRATARCEAAEAEVLKWKESHAANVDTILSHAALILHHKARSERLEAALRDVADMAPMDFAPDLPWCWCGTDEVPVEHQPYCLAARAALAAETKETK